MKIWSGRMQSCLAIGFRTSSQKDRACSSRCSDNEADEASAIIEDFSSERFA